MQCSSVLEPCAETRSTGQVSCLSERNLWWLTDSWVQGILPWGTSWKSSPLKTRWSY